MFENLRQKHEQQTTTEDLGIGSMTYLPQEFLNHDKDWKKACKEIKENHPYDQYIR